MDELYEWYYGPCNAALSVFAFSTIGIITDQSQGLRVILPFKTLKALKVLLWVIGSILLFVTPFARKLLNIWSKN